jgi:hypothetical protein
VTIAITIGAYRLPQFVELCVVQSRKVFGQDVPILVSDDASLESPQIKAVADRHGAAYMCPPRRRSHTSGDWSAFINGAVMAGQVGADVVVKLSQRFIPLAGFKELILDPFADESVKVVVPGQPKLHTFARSSARFFSKFTILSDCVAWRTDSLSADRLMEIYRDRVAKAEKPSDQFVEVVWGHICNDLLPNNHRAVEELANPQIGKAKKYLRKAQTPAHEYGALAAAHGIAGDFPVAEWIHMEGRDTYLGLPTKV